MKTNTINPASFVGCADGKWGVQSIKTIIGESLTSTNYIEVYPSHTPPQGSKYDAWILRGTTTHVRYTERSEVDELKTLQPELNRSEATHAALIPIRKNEKWWEMSQDERRNIFEKESGHISNSMKYLPAIARRLYHCRELGEPFDFLTWFEFAPQHSSLFDELLAQMRSSREWQFVDREIDIRLKLNK